MPCHTSYTLSEVLFTTLLPVTYSSTQYAVFPVFTANLAGTGQRERRGLGEGKVEGRSLSTALPFPTTVVHPGKVQALPTPAPQLPPSLLHQLYERQAPFLGINCTADLGFRETFVNSYLFEAGQCATPVCSSFSALYCTDTDFPYFHRSNCGTCFSTPEAGFTTGNITAASFFVSLTSSALYALTTTSLSSSIGYESREVPVSSNCGLSPGAYAGIALGAILFISLLGGLVVVFLLRRRHRTPPQTIPPPPNDQLFSKDTTEIVHREVMPTLESDLGGAGGREEYQYVVAGESEEEGRRGANIN
ncbi:hypothetical protein BCR35DRAFT_301557 [Leucosporidium creatinivorum]|uniref:Uncharacterized protein n=1 Tax=Leucosporidium creatinivorum TaxID=106004 RepID=A0A1Y2FWQ9_9BASI|nr:hypothetical protein BCR35DRAFT_301557 [Leucosporidium creatinivorum]